MFLTAHNFISYNPRAANKIPADGSLGRFLEAGVSLSPIASLQWPVLVELWGFIEGLIISQPLIQLHRGRGGLKVSRKSPRKGHMKSGHLLGNHKGQKVTKG